MQEIGGGINFDCKVPNGFTLYITEVKTIWKTKNVNTTNSYGNMLNFNSSLLFGEYLLNGIANQVSINGTIIESFRFHDIYDLMSLPQSNIIDTTSNGDETMITVISKFETPFALDVFGI